MPTPQRPLAGRAVLVTDVGRRTAIGAAIARRLAQDGARLVLHSWSSHDAEQTWGEDVGGTEAVLAELRAHGADAVATASDFADRRAPADVVDATRAKYGHLDAVVAAHARSSHQSIEQVTAAEIDRTYAVNTRATLLLVQRFAAEHDGRAGGRVVLFTSGQHHEAMPAELPYVASKAALHQLTPSLAVALAAKRITVNCVDPGPTDTGAHLPEELRDRIASRIPLGRWGRPSDAARLVAWLMSDEAEWVTGQVIASDGGWSARSRV